MRALGEDEQQPRHYIVMEAQSLNCAIVFKSISECIHACITDSVTQVKVSQCSMLSSDESSLTSLSPIPQLHTRSVLSRLLWTRLASDFPSIRAQYVGPSTTIQRREVCLLITVVKEGVAQRVCLLTRLILVLSLSSHIQSKRSTNSLMVELFLTAAVRVARSVAVTWFRTTVSGNFS